MQQEHQTQPHHSLRFKAHRLLSYFTRHRTAANLILIVMMAAGIAALPRMTAQFFPDVVVESVSVSVQWDGAGAEDVDNAIVQLLEPALLSVEGVEGSDSMSREGQATINLEFTSGWDMARATEDVQLAVDAVTNLPQAAEEPFVRRMAWRDRVTDVVITGPVSVDQLGRFADEFVTRLFAAGVTRSTIRGVAAPNTVVEVSSLALIRHDVSMAQIAQAIRAEASTNPAGDVEGANARVRTGVAKRSADQLAGIVLRANADGSKLVIGDVADIVVEKTDRNRAYFSGLNPAMSIRVDRSNRGDAIGIQETVQNVAHAMERTLPEGTKIELIRTRSEAITGRLDILLDNGLIGLGLVLLLLFLFLNARTAFWVAAGIPAAMLGAIALMYIAGLTINMVSLFALIITLGIVVDDAIVVGEHADFRVRRLGEHPVVASENAATRMAAPVFSATVTTVIAFFALVVIGGRFGDLIIDIPFTVIVVLLASLVECFLILPNHMSHALTASAQNHWYDWPSRNVTKGFNWLRLHLFKPLIRGVIKARYPVVAFALMLLMSQITFFLRGDVTWRFFDAPERGSISGNFAMLPGATRDDTFAMMRELQRATEEVAASYETEYGRNPLDFVLAEIGGTTGRGLAGQETKSADQLGGIAIELIDADQRPYSSFEFLRDVQEAVKRHPLLETVSFRGWRAGPGGDALHIQLYAAQADRLKAAAEALKAALSKHPEVSALEDSLAYDKEELSLDLTAQGQALGFTIDQIGQVLRNQLNGIEAASYPDGPRSATIRVELPKDELTADFLERSFMRSDQGAYVPLSDIVSVSSQIGFSTVRRENGIRLVAVNGDISEDNPQRAQEILTELRESILPKIETDFGVTSQLAGLAEQEREFINDAAVGFVLCLIGIYLALAWVFASWTRPTVIMLIIPFGLIGTVYGHYLWDVPLSMFTVVGFIGMTGIIINDAIVLVSTVDEYARTRALVPAIVEGVSDRLRPVLLTTLTTVLGLAPLLFEPSRHAQFLKPTVITLCYGLGVGLLIVLIVVPALMVMQADVARQLRALRRGLSGGLNLRHSQGALSLSLYVSAAVLLAFFALTVGTALVAQGSPSAFSHPVLHIIFPWLAGSAPVLHSALVFVGGSAAFLLTLWMIAWRNSLRHSA